MDANTLKHPFSWEERAPAISERILWIPEYYDEHGSFEMPKFSSLFPKAQPIAIEYCSGNGEWILDRAEQHPEKNWIAVEWWLKRVQKIYRKREARGLDNLFIVCGEAMTFSKYYVHDGAFDEIYINFPDPWPKDRHAKHRLMKPEFTEELARCAQENATLTFVTDDEPYHRITREAFAQTPQWQLIAQEEEPDYGTSYFERLWRSLGRHIFFTRMRKTS